MKKQLVAMALGGALVIGSGAFVYNSYAAESETPTQIPVEKKAEAIDTSSAQAPTETPAETVVESSGDIEGLINISDVPEEDIHIPNLAQGTSLKTAAADKHSLKPLNTTALKGDNGLVIRQSYRGTDGTEIMVIQTESQMGEQATIDSLKESYKEEKVESTKINDHTAIYVDGQARKVVHLITKDHFYTVSASNGNLDELMEITKKIQE
ncbi:MULTISPECIES: DUF4367 domain-containing protein [Paenibacillus]|uniref:DUF4367 domain-containing protein n=1 Tax=Paenibacillus TaxID=44249 RepID=UPI0005CF513A|nr:MULTISPECIES: DUF4367 domain-containing protein [Paenibacillus]KJD38058.1 hypothetical protein QD46_21270 [Paenibacillus polymyxa]MBE3650893.1 DUF4367 domain-containing protein [Paenibacillus polymyxa]MBY7740238.1 DUF4367 domain-containing protein [Paenibacillus polymyxa]MCP3746715.1 DUF4367 domain-containing protein [Paenibacillus sp. A3M_27_13]MEE4581044.1 DUF4367 domain-containing protein [Paenibacillus polymyxa]